MVLSNAERQERYRQRLKAAARGDDLAERASAAVEAALAVVFAMDDGSLRENFSDVAAFRAWLTDPKNWKSNGHVTKQLGEMFRYCLEDAGEPEAAVIRRGLAVIDAATLAGRA